VGMIQQKTDAGRVYMPRKGVSADIIGLKSCLEGNLEFLGSRLVWFKNRELDQLPNWEI
jgi:hypothetical protein